MSFVYWKIERYAYTGTALSVDAWSTTAEIIAEAFDPQVTVNLGEAKDTFSFKVTDFNGDFSNYFRPNDQILIYRKLNSTTVASSDILINGSVQNTPETKSGKQSVIRVEGASFSESVLSAVAYFDPQGLDIPTAIQRGLVSVTNFAPGFGVTWSSGNPTTKQDGSAFPEVQEVVWPYKPIKDFIAKYTSADRTGDGNYYWYVNSSKEFVWGPKADSPTATFNSSTDNYQQLRINKDLKDVKNFIILKGGISPKGAAIQDRVQDISSIAKNGIKPYVLVDEAKTAETLLKLDLNTQGVAGFVDMTFPYTPAWNGGVSCADNDEYDAALVAYAKVLLKARGKQLLQKTAGGKLKVDVVWPPGAASWGLGSVVSCTIPSLSASAKNLRVMEISYATESDIFTLEEDTGSL